MLMLERFFSNNLSFHLIELKNEEQNKLNTNRRQGTIYVRTKEMKLKTKTISPLKILSFKLLAKKINKSKKAKNTNH